MKALLTLLMMCWLTACADDAPVRATYVPGECPPCESGPAGSTEADEPIELGESADDEAANQEASGTGVATAGEEGGAGAAREVDTDEASDTFGKVDINAASTLELTKLPGVGPALATRIAEYRDKRPFEKVEDLQRVRGIGPAKLEKMRPHLIVQ